MMLIWLLLVMAIYTAAVALIWYCAGVEAGRGQERRRQQIIHHTSEPLPPASIFWE